MEVENFAASGYSGTRDFSQHDVRKANATGFGAAADDYMERGIDLNEQLVRNKPATFFMRVRGGSMQNAGIFNGDIVVVDKSVKPVSGKVVIAVVDGEMLIRRYEKQLNKLRLIPESKNAQPFEVNEFTDCNIWGVVTSIIRMLP